MKIIQADYNTHHNDIVRIARQSKYTRDFSNHIFSGEAMYQKNWVRIAQEEDGTIVGFYCVRHKTRSPVTELYFILVDANARTKGIGRALIEDMKKNSPHKSIQLNCAKDNDAGVSFYECLGAVNIGESLQGKAHRFELRF